MLSRSGDGRAGKIALMPPPSRPPHSRDLLPDAALQRLIVTRTALILAEAAGIVLLSGLLHARLPLWGLGLILALHALLNGVAWLRLRAGGTDRLEVFLQLAVDAAAIGALVCLTGGYANPFISLLLVPLILAAITLPPAPAWTMAAWVAALYTLLMGFYRPLEIQVSAETAVDLHLTGMWLNFLLTAALVAAFAGRLAGALRRRDAELAEAREQRLRDEQLFALGLQAAAAAHDLATPMASARITLDELRRDYAGDDELGPHLDLLSAQLARMEAVLARLGAAARARGRNAGPPLAAEVWLERVLAHWGLMWPSCPVALQMNGPLPEIEDDAALETVLITLLNNAAAASPTGLRVRASQANERLVMEVIDQGPGLAGAGQSPGWGVGLELARAALTRMGGRLSVGDCPEGGVCARVEWPLEREAGA